MADLTDRVLRMAMAENTAIASPSQCECGASVQYGQIGNTDRGRLGAYIVPEPFNQAFALDRCGRVDACALGDLLDDAMTACSVNGLPGRTEWNTGARAGEVQLSIVGKGSKGWEVLIPTGDRRPAHLPVAAMRRDGSPHSIRVYQRVGETFAVGICQLLPR